MDWLTREWIEGNLREAGYALPEAQTADWDAQTRSEWFLNAVCSVALVAAERRFAERWGDNVRIGGHLKDAVEEEVWDAVYDWANNFDLDVYINTEPLFDGVADFVEDVLNDEGIWDAVDDAAARTISDWLFRPDLARKR